MYTILIADDDVNIRKGLSNLVDWESLGFVLSKICSNGSEVLSFLEANHVDVILTDIKMPRHTGLDIAKYVCERRLPTKVILISAYSEVELAMGAIRFDVKDYILKPINIKQLVDTLERVKELLDTEDYVKRQKHIFDFYSNHMDVITHNFISDLIFGTTEFSDGDGYQMDMFHLIYPSLSFHDVFCFTSFVALKNLRAIQEGNAFLERSSSYDVVESINNFIHMHSDGACYYPVYKNSDNIFIFGVVKSGTTQNDDSHYSVIKRSIEQLCSSVNAIFAVGAQLNQLVIYKGIPNCLRHYSCYEFNNVPGLALGEQEKFIYSAVLDGNFHKVPGMVKKYIFLMKDLPISQVQAIVTEFMTVIKKRLTEANLTFADSLIYKEDPGKKISVLQELSQIEEYITSLLVNLHRHLTRTEQKIDMIDQVKEYVTTHLNEDISLETISRIFFVNQYHFCRVFKNKTGENYIDFVTQNRLDTAAQLLKTSSLKVHEISDMVGYQNPSYFIKIFKVNKGYTPSKYRDLYSPIAGEKENDDI